MKLKTLASLGIVTLAVSLTLASHAQTFSVIHTFHFGSGGFHPIGGLMLDKTGKFYGTTRHGSAGNELIAGYGTVFELINSDSGWVFTTLYGFAGGADGIEPYPKLTLASDGSLYGTTNAGGGTKCYGGYGCGTVFNLKPPAIVSKAVLHPWTETVLYRFRGGSDGAVPAWGQLVFDQADPPSVYGTTTQGGSGDYGTVYKLTPFGNSSTESVLHRFTWGGTDGGVPIAGVIFDGVGNMYGTSAVGGAFDCGTVYELTPSDSGWTEKTLYTFTCGIDGAQPIGGLTFDPSGNLYGTTAESGAGNGGVVFRLAPSHDGWIYNVLHSFTGQVDEENGPYGNLVLDTAGNIYGATHGEGAYGFGNAFKLTYTQEGWVYTSLYDFTGGTDGGFPDGDLTISPDGTLYGTATGGGVWEQGCFYGCGVVWMIKP